MINKRNPDTNLATEVKRKDREMAAKSSEEKEKKRMLIAYISIGSAALILFIAGFSKFSSSEQNMEVEGFETPITDSKKYNSKLEALEAKQEKQRNENLLDIFSSKEDEVKVDTAYQNQLKRNLANYTNGKKKPKVDTDIYGDYSMWEEPKNEEKSTKELNNNKTTPIKEYKPIPSVETRFAVYDYQLLYPNEQVKLILIEDFVFEGKIFQKNTFVYAEMSIQKNRILFDIPNIAHEPLNIEVRDIRDGRIGMRSKEAGVLWDAYVRESTGDAQDDASEIVGAGTNSTLVGKAVKALSKFFKRKKIKKSQRLEFLHNQELIVTIRPSAL